MSKPPHFTRRSLPLSRAPGSRLRRTARLGTALLLALAGPSGSSSAQVVTEILRDGTVGNPDPALQPAEGPVGVWEIGEIHGQRAGRNLFHSFSRFDVGGGDVALFTADPVPTDNVIGRVTGGASSIYGTIRSTIPGADLYLLNPSGIVFGADARLEVQGSFHASTADFLRLRDAGGNEWLAFSPESLLTMATPTAFGFLGAAPAPIEVDGADLEVPELETLSLTGGDLTLSGFAVSPRLAAPGGRLHLLSLAAPGEVDAQSFDFGFPEPAALGDIEIHDGATLHTVGDAGGRISIRGRHVVADGASLIATRSASDLPSGAIEIDATGDVRLDGGARISTAHASAVAGGGIEIRAGGSLFLWNGALVDTTAFGSGRAGDLSLSAGGLVDVFGGDASAATLGAGAGGLVTVSAPQLSLFAGGIDAMATGDGAAGTVVADVDVLEGYAGGFLSVESTGWGSSGIIEAVGASSITFSGQDLFLRASGLHASSFGFGSGGAIFVDAVALALEDAATVDAAAFSFGDAGFLHLEAGSALLDGGIVDNRSTDGFLGGLTEVRAGSLALDGGAAILSGSLGSAPGGWLDIQVGGSAVLSGGSAISLANTAGGAGGGIGLVASSLLVEEGSSISTFASDFGVSGDLSVSASVSVEVAGALSEIGSSSLAGGFSGQVSIATPELSLTGGGAVLTLLGSGSGSSGAIDIDAGRVLVSGFGSQITTQANGEIGGFSGGIDVNASELVSISSNARGITALAEGFAATGEIHIETPLLLLSGGSSVDLLAFDDALAGDLQVTATALGLEGGSEITSLASDRGFGAGLHFDVGEASLSGGSAIESSTEDGPGGDVHLEVGELDLSFASIGTLGGSIGRAGDLTLEVDTLFSTGSSISTRVGDALAPAGGNLSIRATEVIDLFATTAAAVTGGGATSGALVLSAPSIELGSGARVATDAFGTTADAGLLTIEADLLRLLDFSRIESVSSDLGLADRTGATTGISISARWIEIGEGAQIVNQSFGGPLGPLTVEAGESIEIAAFGGLAFAGIFHDHFGPGPAVGEARIAAPHLHLEGRSSIETRASEGDGGDLHLDLATLDLADGAILKSSGGGGTGGDLVVGASEWVRIGGSVLTGIQVFGGSGGRSGAIRIETPELTISDAGSLFAIDSGTPGDVELRVGRLSLLRGGDISRLDNDAVTGGKILIDASEWVLIDDQGEEDAFSGISAFSPIAGELSRIEISTPRFTMRGGSIGTESTLGFSRAGDVAIRAGVIDLSAGARIGTDTFFSSEEGGGIELSASQSFSMAGSSSVTSGTLMGEGDAGDILIAAPRISIVDSRVEVASVFAEGAAGSIAIGDPDHPADRVVLSGARIDTFADIGPQAGEPREGNIQISAGGLLIIEGDTRITASVGEGLGGDIDIRRPERMVMRGGSQILAETRNGTGGAIGIAADLFVPSADSRISADAGVGADGIVEIDSPEVNVESGIAQLPAAYLDASALVRPSCAAQSGRAGSFVVARRKGLPASPEGLLLAFDVIGGGGDRLAEEAEGLPPVAGAPPGAGGIQVAHAALAEGAAAFRGGHFEQAGERWAQASALSVQSGDARARSDALRGIAQSQQALGRYAESVETLNAALALAERSGDRVRIAASLGGLGNAYLALGQPEVAHQLLTRALGLASQTGDPGLAARILNDLGNQEAARGAFGPAIEAYRESAELAARSGRELQQARALSNAARAALAAEQFERAAQLLERANTGARSIEPSHQSVSILIHLAKSDEQLAAISPEHRRVSLLRAHAALLKAIEFARGLADDRSLSYALGNLGALYQGEHRIQEALYLTRRALRAAEAANAAESIYRWHWQEGQLLWAQGNAGEAIRSYRRAVGILEETRQETLAQYGSAEVHFRRAVAPVYLQLVDALLQSAGRLEVEGRMEPLLFEARSTMEQLKAAELRDYFRDECVADLEAREVALDPQSLARLAPHAAVVYPILLPDRIELLVSLPEGLERHAVDAPSARVREEVRALRQGLGTPATRSYLRPAQTLYDWLVRPYREELEAQGIDTLVFVPGSALRTIPMAALHDGKGFLIQRFALAVTPGLSLLDPKPLDRAQAKVLLAGLSKPVQGFPALTRVADELAAIGALYGGEILLDEAFQARRFEDELAAEPRSIVHLASHAVFTGDPSTSFLLTHDDQLTMDRMADAVGVTQFRDRPLELLALSACETAAGDERAALGLAGVAIRAGARSALASLWRIHDEAAYELMVAFYEELSEPSVSKAQALRRAQTRLLGGPRFSHPFYWSPFLLISNWL